MRWNVPTLASLTALLPVSLAAQTQEAAKAASDGAFNSAVAAPARESAAANAPDPNWLALLRLATAQYFRAHTFQVRPAGTMEKPAAAVAGLDLPLVRNRQWFSPATLALSGTTVRLSGQFSRSGKAYFAVLVGDETAPRFYSLDDLLEGTPRLKTGGSVYQVVLAPDLLDRLGSRVAFRNVADVNDGHGLTIRHILDLVYAAGSPVRTAGPELRVFFGQDVDDQTEPARACPCESVAMLTHTGDEYYTFLVPLEWIPRQGSPALFELRGVSIGLRRNGSQLEFFQP